MILIAGPCAAESYELMLQVATFITNETKKYPEVEYFFKASLDKANRNSGKAYRGPGFELGLEWMAQLKKDIPGLKVTTDVHETCQIDAVAEVCDAIQIPAMLCRQTDLVVKASETGRLVTIKKGMFLSPEAMASIVSKAKNSSLIACIERGTTFGYGDIVVDMRSLKTLAQNPGPVIFDATHVTQRPITADRKVTGGDRQASLLLARAAMATGYIDGIFMEVHPNPDKALSDGVTSLSFDQAAILIKQAIYLKRWADAINIPRVDKLYD